MSEKHKKLAQKEVARTIRRHKLEPEVAADVLQNIVEEKTAEAEAVSGIRVPGSVIGGRKTPWTVADMDWEYGIVTFTPERTIPITPHGIKFQLYAGREMTCPGIVKTIYEQSLKAERDALRQLPPEIIVEVGAGALSGE